VRIRVLGPVEVVGDGSRSRPLAPKARQLLTLLAVHAPRAVGIDELAELLWDDPPPAATKTIQAHVSRLRAALGSAGAIELTGVGYTLRAEPGMCDLDLLANHRAAARRWRGDGRLDEAIAALGAARALWRGNLELPDTAAAHGLAARWEREHRLLVDEHLTAVVDGAHPGDVVSELQEATATDPLDERRWALLVRALHRAGDVPGALRTYQAARAALADVGLEPGAALHDAEAAAVTGVTEPAPAPATPTTPAAPLVRYADTGAGRVAYIVIGDGSPQPEQSAPSVQTAESVQTVVLNPGLFSIDGIAHQPRLARAVARLATSGAVACLDRRGIGLSDPVLGADPTQPPSIDDWAADVLAVLDATDATETAPVLFACSDTGLAALAVAAAHPGRVRGLVLVHGYARYTRGDGYPYGVDHDTAVSTSADVLDVDATEPGFDPLAHIAPSVAGDPEFRRWFDDIGRRAASPHVAAALHHAIHRADVRHLLPAVSAPVLLLHRRSCASVDIGHARYLRDKLPNAQLVLLPGADELWFVGDTAALTDEVDRWLADLRPAASA
jgi:DNA-binding SARP family transcriptional activator/pimeloyl-ACP methyl ester carboxylesterase